MRLISFTLFSVAVVGCASTPEPLDQRPAASESSTLFLASGQFPSGIEGPAVDADGTLYVVNFGRKGTVGKLTMQGEASLFVELPDGSTGNGIRFTESGDMLIADYTGHNVLRVDMDTKAISAHAHEPDMNQPNDLAIDSVGRVYCSDPKWADSTGQLWRVDPDGTPVLLDGNMGTTNGVEVSTDERTLYVAESVQRKVWAFDLSSEGDVSNKRLLIEFPDHGLDGMRCDAEGNLWLTRFGGGKVLKVSPSGEVLHEVALIGERPTNIAFGGPDGRTCFVTIQDDGSIETFRADVPGRSWMMRQKR